MNQEVKQLPMPSFTPEHVQELASFANEKLPTMYGNQILEFIKKVALENKKATQVEEIKAS